MIPLKLWYSDRQTSADLARTHDELDAAMDRIAALSGPDWRALGEVTQADDKLGSLLYVGLHADRGALMFGGAGEARLLYTLGAGDQNGEPLLYLQGTSDFDLPPNAEVPAEVVRQATHEFADTGRRPTCVEWQAWEGADTEPGWPNP